MMGLAWRSLEARIKRDPEFRQQMIEKYRLDIRTVTMGISLLSCSRSTMALSSPVSVATETAWAYQRWVARFSLMKATTVIHS